jgi:hypothetical protein
MPAIEIPEPSTATVDLREHITERQVGMLDTAFVPAPGDTVRSGPGTWRVLRREWDFVELDKPFVTLYVERVLGD